MKFVCVMTLRNWATVCLLLAVVLLLYHDPFLIFWWPQKPAELQRTKSEGFPLDMATESVDDMYDGCRSEAASHANLFCLFEWRHNQNFSFAWASAEISAKEPAHEGLSEEHAVAIRMYTEGKQIRGDFNRAVKTEKHKYGTRGFMFHYFYFHLTDALQVLQPNQTLCRTAHYRTGRQFDHNVINTNMRFGAFTLAASAEHSFDSNGSVSCFEIYTCFGADVTHYSATNQTGQVLIPPYEVFNITDVLTNDPRCTVVYKLHSTKTPRTDLNCKLNDMQMRAYFGAVSTKWAKCRVAMLLACSVLIALALVRHRQKRFVAAVFGSLLVLMIIAAIQRLSQ